VLTAPIPGVSTPSFPFGGATLTGLRIRFPPVRLEVVKKANARAARCFLQRNASPRSFLSVARFICVDVCDATITARRTIQNKRFMMRQRAMICKSNPGAQVANP
jgi:hypothetical protein